MRTTFKATGMVYGVLWGNGEGSYPSTPINADTREELLKTANEKLEDDSLDSGMGFQRLLGALLEIDIITTIEQEGIEYTNISTEQVFIGDLSEEQKDFLLAYQYQ